MDRRQKRKSYTPDFKARVVLEAIDNRLTIRRIAEEFSVHRNQIFLWKKQFVEMLTELLEDPKEFHNRTLSKRLHKKIQEMEIEQDWIKKKIMLTSPEIRKEFIEPGNELISVRRQCRLLDLNRSTFFYRGKQES